VGLARRPPALTLPLDGDASDDQLPSSVECIAAAVSPLNPAVREKWVRRLSAGESANACSTPTALATSLAARLAAADSRREQFRAWVMRRATVTSRVRKVKRKHGSATALVFLASPPRKSRPVQDLSADSDDDGAWRKRGVHGGRGRQGGEARFDQWRVELTVTDATTRPGNTPTRTDSRLARLEARLQAAAERRSAWLAGRRKARLGSGRHPAAASAQPDTPKLAAAAAAAASTRRVQRAWRAWVRSQRTGRALAEAFTSCGVSRRGSADFDAFATALTAPATLRATRALMTRLDALLTRLGKPRSGTDHLLRRLFPSSRKSSANAASHGTNATTPTPTLPDRYPARVLLCAWMVTLHPEVVLRQRGEREAALRASASACVESIEALLTHLCEPAGGGAASPHTPAHLSQLLMRFDGAWERYLDQFAVWKSADAEGLETELVAMAAALQASLLRKIGVQAVAAPAALSHDRRAMVEGVRDDVGLIEARVAGLTGVSGVGRLRARLAAVAAQVAEEEEANAAARVAAAQAAGAAGASAAAEAPPALSNERILYELMHDPSWRLPRSDEDDVDGEDDGKRLLAGVRATVAQAFWDALASSRAPMESSAAMLRELRSELLDLTPASIREAVATSTGAALDALESSPGAASLGIAIRCFADVIRMLCAPARRAALEAALGELHAAEQQLLQSDATQRQLGAVAACALRALFKQMRLLKRDVANAQLSLLIPLTSSDVGARAARDKFAARHALPVGGALPAMPRTRAFFAAAAAALPSLERELAEALEAQHQQQRDGGASAASPVAPAMHTGRRASAAAPPPSSGAACAAAPPPAVVASLRSAPALLRIGLVAAVSSNGEDAATAETLEYDGARLRSCSEDFSRCLLTAAALLLLPQLRAASPHGGVVTAAEQAALRLRFKALLAYDTGAARSAHAAAELARIAHADAAQAERLLERMTAPGPARDALSKALVRALHAHLLLGSPTRAAAALARAGAAVLQDDLAELAARVARVADVSERVHGELYEQAASELLEQ